MSSDAFNQLLDNANTEDEESIRIKEKLAPFSKEFAIIQQEDIKLFCKAILNSAPDLFWVAPAGDETEDLPPDVMQPGGNVTHVKRVCRIAAQLAVAHKLPEEEFDILLAAALLHSITKIVGQTEDGEYIFDRFHPYTVEQFIVSCQDEDGSKTKDGRPSSLWIELDQLLKILRIIRCQKGSWGIVPETIPAENVEWLLHEADLMASNIHRLIDGADVQYWRWTNNTEDKDE